MSQRIEFEDKQQWKALPLVPIEKKVTYEDVNQIKAVVNAHADEIEALPSSEEISEAIIETETATINANAAALSASNAATSANGAVSNMVGVIETYNDEVPKVVDFNSADYKVINTVITNPNTRYTTLVDGNGYLQITQIVVQALFVGLLVADNLPKNKLYKAEASFDAPISNSGFGLCINPSSASAIDATNHMSFVWRQNGTLTLYKQDASTVYTGVTFSPLVNTVTIPSFAAGDVLRMTLKYGELPTAGTLSLFLNGVKTNEFDVTGLPIGYMGSTIRNIGPSQVARIRSFQSTLILDKERFFYLDGSGADGNGSKVSPFNNLSSLQNKISEVTGGLNIYINDGTYRGSLQINGAKYPKVNISSKSGGDVNILASTLVNTGWTKTAGFTNIYERPHRFGGVLNSNNANGGIIDLTNAAAPMPHSIYVRNTSNSALATLDGQSGRFLVNTTDRKMYVHALGSVNPNNLQLEISDQQFTIAILNSTGSGYCKVEIDNVKSKYAYSHNIALQRCIATVNNVDGIGSSVSNGFGIDDSIAVLYGCNGNYNRNDGFNAVGGTILGERTKAWFFNCNGIGNKEGDGSSNHNGEWYFYGGKFNSNGKDGIIPTGNAYLYNVEMKGNVSGFQLYPADANTTNSYAELHGCIVENNTNAGIQCQQGSGLVLSATINAYECRIKGNLRGAYVYNTDSGRPNRATINLVNCKDGGGNTTKQVNTGGTLTNTNDIDF